MAFEVVYGGGGFTLEADFNANGTVAGLRGTNARDLWAVIRLKDSNGEVFRREVFGPQATRSITLAANERNAVRRHADPSLGTFTMSNGWRLQIIVAGTEKALP